MKVISAVSLLFVSSANAFSPSLINQRRFASPGYERMDIQLFAGKVGIFFGTSTGSTMGVADMLVAAFDDDAEGPFEIDSIQGSVAKKFAEYDALIVGTPTWNTGADTERSGTGWDEIYYGEMQGKA